MLNRDDSYIPYIERSLEREPRERVERAAANTAAVREIREAVAAARA